MNRINGNGPSSFRAPDDMQGIQAFQMMPETSSAANQNVWGVPLNAQQPPSQASGRRQANYAARPFSDLVDEEKRPFVRRRVIATLLGGYRTVFNEEDEDSGIPIHLHFLQVLVYAIMPAIVIIFTQIMPGDRKTGTIIGGVIPLGINAVIQGISYCISKRDREREGMAKVSRDMDDSVCGKKAWLFLFPSRSSFKNRVSKYINLENFSKSRKYFKLLELLFVIILTGLYGSLMTYFLHQQTLLTHRQPLYGLTIATIVLSSYSLFSKPIPESTPYLTNDSFSIFSSHYQRVAYSIIISGIICIHEFSIMDESYRTYYQAAYIVNFVVLILQMVGVLSSPFVTIMRLFEQFDVHVLGSTPRASDIRIVISLAFNIAIVIAILHFIEDHVNAVFFGVALAWASSHNVMFKLAMLRPFSVDNEKVQMQKEYQGIALGSSPAAIGAEQLKQKTDGFCRSYFKVILGVLARGFVIVCVIGMQGKVSNYQKEYDETKKQFQVLSIIAFALAIVHYIISAISRRALWRMIPCFNRENSPDIISPIIRLAITYILTYAYCRLLRLNYPVEQAILFYRAFNRLYHSPMVASLETFILMIFLKLNEDPIDYPLSDAFFYFFIIHFIVHRIMIFFNKCIYVLASIGTAYKNKKQQFASQTWCFLLQFTLFLPFFLLTLVVSTFLNSATIPYLGFAYFIIGYPKPQRGWSTITPQQANANDQRSDGHLYQAMLKQMEKQIQSMACGDPYLFRAGSYYLLKNEKMIALIQILERGSNYVVYTLKGTELQETTVCHAEENENINNISEDIFKHKRSQCNFNFALAPIKSISFGIYEDQKASLTGIIDHPDFATLFKHIYMRTLAMKLRDLFRQQGQQIEYYRPMKSEPSSKEFENAMKFVDQGWIRHLDFDFSMFRFSQKPIPKVVMMTEQKRTSSQNRVITQAPLIPGGSNFSGPGMQMMRTQNIRPPPIKMHKL